MILVDPLPSSLLDPWEVPPQKLSKFATLKWQSTVQYSSYVHTYVCTYIDLNVV